jgi:hypothetical protein
MDEQSQNESQPKVRRAKSGGAEEPQPGVTRAGSTGESEQETPENVSEKLSQAGEEVSPPTNKENCRVESVLPWPFQATQHALNEWTRFFGRTLERNSRAASDLSASPSAANALRWQRDLVQSNVEDWLETSFAVFAASVRKTPHARAGQ